MEYNHNKIEKKWQEIWQKSDLYKADDDSKKPKKYLLVEFPYPSGAGLHVGHARSYTALDIMARTLRMQGFNVMYPIGWDAFGLPTENYAIKNKIHPKQATEENIATFKRQLKELGLSFDWSREINTTDPSYYKWTQWIFLQLYKKGLAYKKQMAINWCPSCKIGLAHEEVVDGKCERCGAEVEQRDKEQWMLAITKYADRLIKDLDTVDYLDKIKTQQVNWIGKSEGASIKFQVTSNKSQVDKIEVFTTRPDTLFGATYMVLAPEHKLVAKLKDKITNWKEVKKYIKQAQKKNELQRGSLEKEKTGVELKGIKAVNPANNEEIPVWIADYVLASYGTGAIMAVPAHDERDFKFAEKYNIPIKFVIEPDFITALNYSYKIFEKKYKKFDFNDVDHWNNLSTILYFLKNKLDEKKLKITEISLDIERGILSDFIPCWQTTKNDLPPVSIDFKISILSSWWDKYDNDVKELHEKVQRGEITEDEYWHTQKVSLDREILNQELCALLKNKKIKLPILVSDLNQHINKLKPYTDFGFLIDSGEFDDMDSEEAKKAITKKVGGKIITQYKLRDWVFSRQHYWGEPIPIVNCDKCGLVSVPEKDLPVELPDVKNYEPTDTGESPLASITEWVNTKCPQCGGDAKRETDTMPNWAGSSWYFLRYCDPQNNEEFADAKKLKYWTPVDLYNGGMEHTTLHLLYSRFWHKFLYDQKLVPTSEPYARRVSHGMVLAEDGKKMSKSLGNVINPDEVVKNIGADSLRLYEMFMGPFAETIPWSTEGVRGVRRFLEKVWNLQATVNPETSGQKTEVTTTTLLHKTIKKITEDIENMKFNTAISAMMIFLNEVQKEGISKEDFEKFLIILAPFVPHMCEELWSQLGYKESIFQQSWPKYDENLIKDDTVKIAVQINGKLRDTIEVKNNISEEEVKEKVLASEKVQKWLKGKEIVKIIFIKNKLISIVIK